ncbi:hypothetical protein AML91_19900 [Paenibacillus jilunlii]|uniref:Uncharacterized protein n=1 Tax=Paenibacillus jilunlii TaxID=682956 RepID=A0ABR5SV18_9BACL|nr:hypothetical protein AML91_19900 [Paenibacillus jilunlii]
MISCSYILKDKVWGSLQGTVNSWLRIGCIWHTYEVVRIFCAAFSKNMIAETDNALAGGQAVPFLPGRNRETNE